MKITCESCGSKYTIADAKVKGRKVKVRCKGCKESILVDGTALDQAEAANGGDEDAPVNNQTSDLWSVNLSDDDSREMTLEQLVQAWQAGVVTSDAYVWKDGMGDWKPILEVGELKLKLSAPQARGGVVSSAAAVAPAAAGVNDLFGAAALAGNETAEPERPSVPAPGGGRPTGARNDSSVLFSLDSLKGASPSQAPASSGEDLFGNLGVGAGMLQTNTDLLTAPAKDPPPAPVGARMAAPAGGSRSMMPIVGAILGAAVIIGAGIFFMGGSDEASSEASEASEAAAQVVEDEQKKAEEERQKIAAELKKVQEELKKKEEEAKKKEEEAKKKAEAEKPSEKEAAEKETAANSDSSKESSSSSSSSSSGSSAPAAKPGFNIGAAKSALASAAANAASCKKPGGPTGSGKVQVTFSTSGRVTSATVISGPFGGTSVGGCVASTFRRARVPAFSGGSQTVAKSFRIP